MAALAFPNAQGLEPLLEVEVTNLANGSQHIPKKFQVTQNSFRAINNLVRDRTVHGAKGTKIKMTFDGSQLVEDLEGSKSRNITPEILARHLAITGRVGRIYDRDEMTAILQYVEEFYKSPESFADTEKWKKHVDAAFWHAIEASVSEAPDRQVGGVATTYQQRMRTWFIAGEEIDGSFRNKLKFHVTQFQNLYKVVTDRELMKSIGFRFDDHAEQSSGEEDNSARRSRKRGMKKMGSRNSGGGGSAGGNSDFVKICWHFCKRTPCKNETTWNSEMKCDECSNGMHATTSKQIPRSEYEKIKKSGPGSRALSGVDYLSWVKDGKYKGPKSGGRQQRRAKSSSSSSSSSDEDEEDKSKPEAKKQKKNK